MYYANINSLLTYCNLIWMNTHPTDLLPLVTLQKRIIRIITHSEFLAHTDPLFNQCRILKIEKLRKFALALHTFKNKENHRHLIAQHNYLTRHRNHLRIPAHRTALFHKSFIYQGTTLWNEIMDLYPETVAATSIESFKRKYKINLLQHQ